MKLVKYTLFSQLLDTCTDKLGLVSAARKLFLSDGTLVTHPRQLPKDVDVYVSCGEAFRDPFAAIRGIEWLYIASKLMVENPKACAYY